MSDEDLILACLDEMAGRHARQAYYFSLRPPPPTIKNTIINWLTDQSLMTMITDGEAYNFKKKGEQLENPSDTSLP
jgi:hypothetical protein